MRATTGRRGTRATNPHGGIFGSDYSHALHFGRAHYLTSLFAMEVYTRPQTEVGAIESPTVYFRWFRTRNGCVGKKKLINADTAYPCDI